MGRRNDEEAQMTMGRGNDKCSQERGLRPDALFLPHLLKACYEPVKGIGHQSTRQADVD